MTIAITGANGQLGTELCRQLGDDVSPLVFPEFDLTSREAIESALYSLRPSAVINTAAYTAVDKAEQDVDLCGQVNADAVAILADVCRQLDCPLVQVSTDYVFETATQRKPFKETDIPGTPRGVYARTKLGGELNAANWEKHFIVRTCGLYSLAEEGPVRGRNFVDTMLSLGHEREQLSVVGDQFCTPTYVPHLAKAIRFLLSTDMYGTYHVTNAGETTWYDFAGEIFRLAELDVKLDAISTEQYGAPSPRPRYSVLDTSKYEYLVAGSENSLGTWQEGLVEYMQQATAKVD